MSNVIVINATPGGIPSATTPIGQSDAFFGIFTGSSPLYIASIPYTSGGHINLIYLSKELGIRRVIRSRRLQLLSIIAHN